MVRSMCSAAPSMYVILWHSHCSVHRSHCDVRIFRGFCTLLLLNMWSVLSAFIRICRLLLLRGRRLCACVSHAEWRRVMREIKCVRHAARIYERDNVTQSHTKLYATTIIFKTFICGIQLLFELRDKYVCLIRSNDNDCTQCAGAFRSLKRREIDSMSVFNWN